MACYTSLNNSIGVHSSSSSFNLLSSLSVLSSKMIKTYTEVGSTILASNIAVAHYKRPTSMTQVCSVSRHGNVKCLTTFARKRIFQGEIFDGYENVNDLFG